MLRLRNRKGQSTAEYAILIGIVISAVIAMQAWVGRTIKAKIHDAALDAHTIVADYPSNLFTTEQFEPGSTSHMETIRSGGIRLERELRGGETTRVYEDETVTRTGNIVTPGVNETE